MNREKNAEIFDYTPSSHGVTDVSRLAWVNGKCVERETAAPSIASLSLHLGLGIFDGMMAYWKGNNFYLHKGVEHVERFIAGAKKIDLKFTWTASDLLQGIEELLKSVEGSTQYVRPIAYRRAPELWVTGGMDQPADVTIFTVKMGDQREIGAPLACQISPIERISSLAVPPQTKVCGVYVNSFNARLNASRSGFDDGIMLDRSGFITEASAANIFFIKDEKIITPKLTSDIFPGITRSFILDLCREIDIEVEELEIHASEVDGMSGAFLCSTLMEMRGVTRIGRRELNTVSDQLFQSILGRFSEVVS
ncbi:aminotransferase class IV [Sphingobium sp. R-21]|uniref:aminotransferase class IV n=1 Tax=Sphingobium sp. R-21 TaxID=3404056 RepID=UPI003CF3F54C